MAELSFRTIMIAILVILIAATAIIFVFSVYTGAESGGTDISKDVDLIFDETKEEAGKLSRSFISEVLRR